MNHLTTAARRSLGVTVLGAISLTLAPAAAGSVGGGAYALSANANALVSPVSIGALPSVTLPPEGGGPYGESLVSSSVAGLLPVNAATVSTDGNASTGSVTSSSSVMDLALAGRLVTVSAASSRCSATTGRAQGSAAVAGLVVAGIPVATTDVGADTKIALPVGTVTLNEQLRTGTAGITVNAARVSLDALALRGDIVIGQSRCVVKSSSRARMRGVRRTRRAA